MAHSSARVDNLQNNQNNVVDHQSDQHPENIGKNFTLNSFNIILPGNRSDQLPGLSLTETAHSLPVSSSSFESSPSLSISPGPSSVPLFPHSPRRLPPNSPDPVVDDFMDNLFGKLFRSHNGGYNFIKEQKKKQVKCKPRILKQKVIGNNDKRNDRIMKMIDGEVPKTS